MKLRILAVAIAGVLLLALGGAYSSDDDSGGGELTLAGYFSELEQLSQAFDSDLDAVITEAEASFDPHAPRDSEDEGIELFTDFVNNLRSTTDDFVKDIDALNAPAEASDAHDEAVAAGEALVEMYDNAITVLGSDTVKTFEQASLVLAGPGVIESQERFNASCVALQGIADSNGLDVDLSCPS